MKKVLASILMVSAFAGTIAIATVQTPTIHKSTKATNYQLELSASNGRITSNDTGVTISTASTQLGNTFSFKHNGLNAAAGKFATFTSEGYLIAHQGVNGLLSVDSEYTGSTLYISFATYGLEEDGDWSKEVALTGEINAPSGYHFFRIRNKNGTTNVSSITINYDCSGLIQDSDIRVYTPVSEGRGYIYSWDAEGQHSGTWPGTAMDNDGEWYFYTFSNMDFINLIFNDGNGSQTSDLSVNGCGDHYYKDGTWFGYNPSNTLNIYVDKSYGQSIYTWDAKGNQLSGNWPGSVMEEESQWYTYTLSDVSFANVIFSDNGANQTADLSINGGGNHYYYNNEWYTVNPKNNLFVFCDKRFDTNVNIYTWNHIDNQDVLYTGTWPGTAMLDYNDDWYYYQVPVGSCNIIFNGPSGQTADMSISGGGKHYYLVDPNTKQGEWHDIEPDLSDSSGLRILHCFDWSMANIQSRLDEIKAAGFDAVQTSPLQMPKDYNAYYAQYESTNWWKLYQPVSFSVGNAWLGNVSSLTSLCTAAKAKGIKVIVDVVANHMANNGDGEGNYALSPEVQYYEADIYNNSATTLHQYHHSIDDASIKNTVWGNMGMPDLNTANATVQNRVYNYLKQLIDCGVTGFRFDAAKHIETSEDGEWSSDFWKNTLGAAKSYAKSKSVDIFAYGEMLETTALRPYSNYTNHAYMNAMTDASLQIGYLSHIDGGTSYYDSRYDTGLLATKNVVWGESHDTYMNGWGNTNPDNTGVTQAVVDRVYALMAARNKVNLLYFARPSGTIGVPNAQNTWTSTIVDASNEFHNLMEGNEESHSSNGNSISCVERSGTIDGAVIVNSNAVNGTISLDNIDNGAYTDLITGSTYTVSNHRLTVSGIKTLVLVQQVA